MNSKKGFTLIELLAVIVILAVIALITVPAVMNVVTEAKLDSVKASAYGYISAIEYKISFLNNDMDDTNDIALDGGFVDETVDVKGTAPTTVGVELVNGAVDSGFMKFDRYIAIIEGGIITDVYEGDLVTEFAYTGAIQTFTAPITGTYLLETWGAQGGTDNTAIGGKGGYAKGSINLNQGQVLYVYVGGQGSSSTNAGWLIINGGYNGGGGIRRYADYAASGGGATDISLVGGEATLDAYYRYARTLASYQARIIVAGGGGGGRYGTSTIAGYGGGTSGGGTTGYSSGLLRTAVVNVQTGGFGTQTTGGNAELFPSYDYADYAYASAAGSLGLGGTYYSAYQSNTAAGGGGAGYYGGGVNCHGGGGGGSSYITGLTNASTIAGNSSMTAPTGESETGHAGNGYARISY